MAEDVDLVARVFAHFCTHGVYASRGARERIHALFPGVPDVDVHRARATALELHDAAWDVGRLLHGQKGPFDEQIARHVRATVPGLSEEAYRLAEAEALAVATMEIK